jgi:chemotaxis protein CheC
LETILSDHQKQRLAAILGRGAADASVALSRWLGRPVAVNVAAVDQVDLAEASEVLGPSDALVAACAMELSGILTGQLILVFEDRCGLATVDMLLDQPVGTAKAWDELEQSAVKETANIVGCAYLNSLAAHFPAAADASLLPGPPSFRHEFAASLLQFALMDQAMQSDRLLVINSIFSTEDARLDWSLLLVPSGASLETLQASLGGSSLGEDRFAM